MTRTYRNPWIPAESLRILADEQGTILDVGGGAAPYCRANHIVDIQAYDADRLIKNRWGGEMAGNVPGMSGDDLPSSAGKMPDVVKSSVPGWRADQYTQLDLCSGKEWPLRDKQFDLGLCSHCLEDLRDPIPVVSELSRVCRRVLVIGPSRLLEQTKGIDHPAYCGFFHHPWIMFEEDGRLIFRRRTAILELRNCHIVCPIGRTLRNELGAMYILGENLRAEERVFWDDGSDYQDYVDFIRPYLGRRDLFVPDGRRHGLLFWVWRYRQKYLGQL